MTDPPDFSRRWIPAAKIRDYLLSERSQKSRSRHKFFLGFGFEPARWEVLRDALSQHVTTARVEWARQNEHGHIWRAVGRLTTPDGRNPMVAVYWIVEFDDPRPRLTSAVPHGG